MEKELLYSVVRNALLTELARTKVRLVPAVVSTRHVHLSRKDADRLFGTGFRFQPDPDSLESGQAAGSAAVTLLGPRGAIRNVRVRSVERTHTQVELSVSDCIRLGVRPELRLSGDLDGTPGLRLGGPSGALSLESGVIVSARHLHLSEKEADAYGLKDKDIVCVQKNGVRPTRFDHVIVRIDNCHSLALHLDTDEGNAAGITCGDLLELISEDNNKR